MAEGVHFLRFIRRWFGAIAMVAAFCLPSVAIAQELKFPQIITIYYDAKDPHVGGQFVLWVEREKIWYGLDGKYGQDSKIYPAAKSVEVTHITPGSGYHDHHDNHRNSG